MHDPRDFIWTTLNLFAKKMLYAKYQCIPASGSWEEDFWSFIKIYLILPLIGPQKGPAPLSEQFWIPISKHVSYQVWLVEIGLVVLDKKSFKGKSWCQMDRWTTDTPWHKLTWPSASGELINTKNKLKTL